jgi:Flagellar basal-body P-ring protein
MKKFYAVSLLIILTLILSLPAMAQEAGPDQPDHQIWGFGLVVGLQGTGDAKITERTRQALALALEEGGPGRPANPDYYRPGNVAYVTIIANLPANHRPGDQIDVTMSALGDARDLRGGILLPSPLRGPDDKVYALAEGTVNVEMLSLEGVALTGFDQPLTRARIANGATINQTIASSESPEYYTVRLSTK